MPRQVQPWISTLVGAAVVLLAIWLVARNFQPPKAIGKDPHPKPAMDDGGTMQALMGAAAPQGDGGLPLLLSDLVDEARPRLDGGVGNSLFDGSSVPPLPMNAPRQVRFGIVLVSYDGAQPSPASSRVATRSKSDARALAEKLFATAQQDFHAAVQQGDGGSSDDVGRVKLGILEAAPEYVLFTLPIDGVGGPVDTPRGFWIVKRIE